MKQAFRLLLAAGVLMLLAGAIFAVLRRWLCAGVLGAGALGCMAAALAFRNRQWEKTILFGRSKE